MANCAPCQVVLLTPIGRGAVSSVLVAGEAATATVENLFRPAAAKPLARCPIDRIVFGRWSPGGGGSGEELVVCRRDPQLIEVHCHGGRAAAESLVRSLVDAGCDEVSWRDWIACTEPDPLAAAARLRLSHARTERTAGVLLDQYRGALRRAIQQIVTLLETSHTHVAADRLGRLQQFADLGLHLVEPWQVVLAGRPNVGKSSVINALVGYHRAIVYHRPGTTRDVVTARTALDGWPVQLADTAGLRHSDEPIEAAALDRARAQLAAADLVVLVFDLSQPWTLEDQELLNSRSESIVVHNKSDLVTSHRHDRPVGVLTSALSGQGIDQLAEQMTRWLVPTTPPRGAAVPFTAEQIEAVNDARRALARNDTGSAMARLNQIAPRA